MSFAFYQMSLSEAINSIGWVFSGMMQALGAAEKVFAYIDNVDGDDDDDSAGVGGVPAATDAAAPPCGDIAPPQHLISTLPEECDIRFEHVSFAYPSRPNNTILNDISFTVQQGECVALVGESGGGKSTCIELLQGFYDIARGQISIGGVDLRSIDRKTLHCTLTSVSQEPTLFSLSVADNIAYAMPIRPSPAEIEAAAVRANCAEFIAALPDGFATQTGERGTLLSGGQKQRIAIARALVRGPKILLLDEATSALDAESESVVQDALRRVYCTCDARVLCRWSILSRLHCR